MFTKKPEPGEQCHQDGGAAQQRGQISVHRATGDLCDQGPKPCASKMVPSIIGEDLTITGNVTSKGEIQVDGEIQGDINCGSLLLGDKSQVMGSVIAEDIVVRGRVTGSIRGLRVTLQAQSHVEGDIFHQSLAIEQGAYFEGKSRRSDDPLAELKNVQAAASPRPEPKPASVAQRSTEQDAASFVGPSPLTTRAAE